MLTGDLVRVRTSKERIIPLYLNRNSPQWLEAAESLLAVFREGVGMTRGEIEEEIDQLFGSGGKATLVHRGIAKVLEDRAEFEVVADVPPEQIRDKVFTAAAEARRRLARTAGPGKQGQPDVPTHVSPRRGALVRRPELKLPPETLLKALFADLRDENRLLKFQDMTAQRLIDRYNVALAQAVLLRSVRVDAEIRNEGPRALSPALPQAQVSPARSTGCKEQWPMATPSRSTAHSASSARPPSTACRWLSSCQPSCTVKISGSTPSFAGGPDASRGASISMPAPVFSPTSSIRECTYPPRSRRSSSDSARLPRPGI